MTELGSIVGRLEQELGAVDGEPLALEGGITNRNFRLRLGDRDYVLRLPGKNTSLLGISREAERLAGEAAAELGIGPRVAAADDSCLVTEYLGGAPLDSQQVRERADAVAHALRAFHGSNVSLPVSFWVPELLERYAELVEEHGGALPPNYRLARQVAARIAGVLPLARAVPCHNDLLAANVLLVGGERVMLVDWEYAGMGHPMFDLGNVAVNSEFDDAAEERLLTAYFSRSPQPRRRAALKLMRLMSDAREAAWGVLQAVISELQFDFEGYAQRHFERLHRVASSHQFEEWLGAAAA